MNRSGFRTRYPLGLVISLAVVAAFLPACGGSDNPTDPSGPTVIAAPTITAASDLPLEPMTVSGPPGGRTDLVLEVAADDALTYWPLSPRDDVYDARVPLHPSRPVDGGALALRVLGTDLASDPAAFSVGSLPAAPGAFAAFTDAFQMVLDQRFVAAGTTRDAVLASDWQTELAPELYQLAVAQTMLDDPSHARGLKNLAGVSTDFDDLFGTSERDLDLLDRLIAGSGLAQLLADEAERLRAAPASAVAREIAINSAAALDAAMEAGRGAAREISPESATGELLQVYGVAAGAVGLAGGPVAAVASAGLSTALFAYSTYREGQSKLLPTSFVSLSFDAAPLSYQEDDGTPGSWSNVRVAAQSEGWTLDRTMANLLLQLAGVRDGYTSWLTRFSGESGNFARNVAGFLGGTGVGRLPADQDGLVTIEPQVWSGIDITGLPWSEARVVGQPAIAITADLAYEPIAAGTATLTVETAPARFGGAPSVLDRKDVTVEAITVTVTASATNVEPGETVDIEAVVEGAQDTGLEWSLSTGSWLSAPADQGGGLWTAVLLTPGDPALFPVVIVATSTATGGARSQPDAPERSGSVVIGGGEVTVFVMPIEVCLQPGEQQVFDAVVVGADDSAVNWSALGPGGAPVDAITTGGLFTAPQQLGAYTVIATSDEDPSAQGVATVEVGACLCSWSATITGTPGGMWGGDFIAHSFPDEFGIFQVTGGTEEDGDPWASVGITANVAVGQIGDFPCTWSLGLSDGSAVWVANDSGEDENLSATLTIVENTRQRVIGMVSGTAVVGVGDGQFAYVPFSMSFRSGHLLSGGCDPED